MSEQIVAAIIGAVGLIVAACITAWATLRQNSPPKMGTPKQRSGEAVADQIVRAVRRGEMKEPISAADVRARFGEEGKKDAYLSVVLSGYAVDENGEDGYYVRHRQKPRFRRISRGLYEIFRDEDDEDKDKCKDKNKE